MAKEPEETHPPFDSDLFADQDGSSYRHPERLLRNEVTDIREPYPKISVRTLLRVAPKRRKTSRS